MDKLLVCPECDTHLSTDLITLEVTETALLVYQDRVREQFQELQEKDVTIFLDDFGTGYSSFTHLHQWPIDGLKIDHTFVSNLPNNPDKQTMVRSLIRLGKEFDLTVVPEGVEQDSIREFLLEEGGRYGQGYGLGKPMSRHGRSLNENIPKHSFKCCHSGTVFFNTARTGGSSSQFPNDLPCLYFL